MGLLLGESGPGGIQFEDASWRTRSGSPRWW